MRPCTPALRYLAAFALICTVPQLLSAQAKPLNARDVTVAGIQVGVDSSKVRKALGHPDSIAVGFDPSQSGPLLAWYYPTLQVIYLTSAVHGIWLVDNRQATVRGLQVGDSVAKALRLYGPPTGPGSTIPPGLSWNADIHRQSTIFYLVYDSVTITRLYVGHNID